MKKKLEFLGIIIFILASIVVIPIKASASNDISVFLEGEELKFDVPAQVIEGRTLLPLRVIFEKLGLKVLWDDENRTVTGINKNREIFLKIDSRQARVNGVEQLLDVPATTIDGRTLVPVRFIAESLDMNVLWDGENKSVKISKEDIVGLEDKSYEKEYAKIDKKTIEVMGQNKVVNLVTIDLNAENIELGVTISNDRIGGDESFTSIIERKNPLAGINANYFDSYNTLEPIGAIAIDNEFQYLEGSPASMIVYDDGKIDMGNYKMEIKGYINGQRENKWNNEKQAMDFNLFKIWYVNNIPKDKTGVYLFNSSRGEKISLNDGIAIIVRNDKVVQILENTKEVDIPKDGYIIYYGDIKTYKEYVDLRFKIGNTIELEYEIERKKIGDAVNSYQKENKIKSLISAGPYLVEDGRVIFNPDGKEFKEDKIIKDRAQRSAIGLTKENKLLLVTGSDINIMELSNIMVQLGADKAMNLDGGASSALYANGKLISSPGRKLSTVLMIYSK